MPQLTICFQTLRDYITHEKLSHVLLTYSVWSSSAGETSPADGSAVPDGVRRGTAGLCLGTTGARGASSGGSSPDPADRARSAGVPASLPLPRPWSLVDQHSLASPVSLMDPHSLTAAPFMGAVSPAVKSARSGALEKVTSPPSPPIMVTEVRDTGRGVAALDALLLAPPSLLFAAPSLPPSPSLGAPSSLGAPLSLGTPPSLGAPSSLTELPSLVELPSLGAPDARLSDRGGVPVALCVAATLDRGTGGGGVTSSITTPLVMVIPSPCEPDARDSGLSGESFPLSLAEDRDSGLGVLSAGLASPEPPELTEPGLETAGSTSGQISTRDREWPWMMRTGVSITSEREWACPERGGGAAGGISSTREREWPCRPRPTARPERCELELPWNVEKVAIFRESQSSA